MSLYINIDKWNVICKRRIAKLHRGASNMYAKLVTMRYLFFFSFEHNGAGIWKAK